MELKEPLLVKWRRRYKLWNNYPWIDIRQLYDMNTRMLDQIKEFGISLTKEQESQFLITFNKIMDSQVNLTKMNRRENSIKHYIRNIVVAISQKVLFFGRE